MTSFEDGHVVDVQLNFCTIKRFQMTQNLQPGCSRHFCCIYHSKNNLIGDSSNSLGEPSLVFITLAAVSFMKRLCVVGVAGVALAGLVKRAPLAASGFNLMFRAMSEGTYQEFLLVLISNFKVLSVAT